MYERKLIQMGNSLGVTLPPEVMKELGIGAGDWLKLEVQDGIMLTITKSDLKTRTKEHGEEVRRHRAALTGTKKK